MLILAAHLYTISKNCASVCILPALHVARTGIFVFAQLSLNRHFADEAR